MGLSKKLFASMQEAMIYGAEYERKNYDRLRSKRKKLKVKSKKDKGNEKA